jgi:hypothetical protein
VLSCRGAECVGAPSHPQARGCGVLDKASPHRHSQPRTTTVPASSKGCTALTPKRSPMPPKDPVKAVRWEAAQERYRRPSAPVWNPIVITPWLLHLPEAASQNRHTAGRLESVSVERGGGGGVGGGCARFHHAGGCVCV